MIVLRMLVEARITAALGWALVHSVWQGALAALVVGAALFAFRSARARYAVACVSMLGVLAAFAWTFVRLLPQQHAPDGKPVQLAISTASQRQFGENALAGSRFFDDLPWIVPFWIAGGMIFHLCTMAGWMAGRRLRRRGVCRAADPWPERLDQLRARIQISRPVTLLESCIAEVPVVVGYQRPVILFPAGLLSRLPASQVEAILLHELAHVRRGDYLVNLLQRLAEGLLFYHPAIWWISNTIRAERENCCDDLAVSASGNAPAYAAALAVLEEARGAGRQAALAATGGNLTKRIHRLLYQPKHSAYAPLLSAGILALGIAGVLVAWQVSTVDPAAQAPQTKASAYTKWIDEDVVYLADLRERAAFLRLTSDEERNRFIEQFWERRNPTPGSPENGFKTEHYRQLSEANRKFASKSLAGWRTDRGRIYILYGPPDEMESHPHGLPEGNGVRERTLPSRKPDTPFEQWMYYSIKGIGNKVIMDFIDEDHSGNYRMSIDPAVKK